MDFSEKWGKDVEEAIKLALADLKVPREEVDVIVLEESSKGFFGLGSKLAKVRVEKKKNPEPKPTTEPKKETGLESKAQSLKKEPYAKTEVRAKTPNRVETPDRKQEKGPRPQKEEKPRRPVVKEMERPVDLVPVQASPAVDFIREVTEKMGLTLQIEAMQNNESIYIDIQGKDSGAVIGKRGQTLDSLQYLTSLVTNKEKEKEKYIRVVVDAESYRSKREKTLEQLADRLAGKVVRTRRSVRLEPMNPYERKVIHATLQSNSKVTTRSEGEEPYRRVIIELK